MNEAAPRSHSELPASGGHERTDVSPAIVGLFALGLLLLLAGVLYAVGRVSRWFDASIQHDRMPYGRLLEDELPPEPRLQADPAAALAQWRAEQEARRSSYELSEGNAGVIRIPVDQAMEILARRGFPEPNGRSEEGTPDTKPQEEPGQ